MLMLFLHLKNCRLSLTVKLWISQLWKKMCCNGIEECRLALLKKRKGVLDANFIEGMACLGGCIGGAGCLTHGVKNKAEVDKYGKEAFEKTISEAISVLK